MLSSIWVATITGLPACLTAATIRRCTTGTSSGGSSTPRSPRATITPSACRTKLVEMVERRRLLQFDDQRRVLSDQLAGFGHIFRALHEGEGNPVDAELQRRRQVL